MWLSHVCRFLCGYASASSKLSLLISVSKQGIDSAGLEPPTGYPEVVKHPVESFVKFVL